MVTAGMGVRHKLSAELFSFAWVEAKAEEMVSGCVVETFLETRLMMEGVNAASVINNRKAKPIFAERKNFAAPTELPALVNAVPAMLSARREGIEATDCSASNVANAAALNVTP